MKYLLMIYSEEKQWARVTDAQKAQGMAAYNAYTDAISNASGWARTAYAIPTRQRRSAS